MLFGKCKEPTLTSKNRVQVTSARKPKAVNTVRLACIGYGTETHRHDYGAEHLESESFLGHGAVGQASKPPKATA